MKITYNLKKDDITICSMMHPVMLISLAYRKMELLTFDDLAEK